MAGKARPAGTSRSAWLIAAPALALAIVGYLYAPRLALSFCRAIPSGMLAVNTGPFLAVDAIIEMTVDGKRAIVLGERLNPPFGLALPGGFVDYGESMEDAAQRETHEETNLHLYDFRQWRTYSDPKRDPRRHTVSLVFVGKARGTMKAKDDAREVHAIPVDSIPWDRMSFDHGKILQDYLEEFKLPP